MGAGLFFAATFLGLWASSYFLLPPLANALRSFGRGVADRLRRHARFARPFGTLEPYLPLLLALALGAGVALWAADSFMDVARDLKEHSAKVQTVDASVYRWFAQHRTPTLNMVFIGATDFGSPIGMAIVVAAVTVTLVTLKRYRWAAYLVVTAAGGAGLDAFLKRRYLRARPDLKLAVMKAHGYSFPSGHAMGSTVVLIAVAYVAVRALSSWRQKSAILALAATLITAVSISRLYLGVHWTSDVVAGIVAGLLWVSTTTGGYEVVRQYRRSRAQWRSSLNDEKLQETRGTA